jgi:hypothetical protein
MEGRDRLKTGGARQPASLKPTTRDGAYKMYYKAYRAGLSTIREMIKNSSSEVAKRQLGKCWVDRFIKRNKIYLISK